MAIANTIVIITGANTGLGLCTVHSLLQSSHAYTILLAGRSIDKADAAADAARTKYPESKSTIETLQLDIEDDESVEKAREWVKGKFGRLDVLINNAGAAFDTTSPNLTPRQMYTQSFSTNTTSTQLLTSISIPLLLASPNPRLLFITSGTSSLAECGETPLPVDKSPEKGWPKGGFNISAYRASKAAQNMLMREWVRLLKGDGVKIWAVSPGFLATGLGGGVEMNRKMGAKDPMIGADFIRDVVEGKRDGDVGKVVRISDVQPF